MESNLAEGSGAEIDEEFCSSYLSSHLVFFFGDGLVTLDLFALNLFSRLFFRVIWIWCSTSCFLELKKSLKLFDPSSFFSSAVNTYVLTGSLAGEAV